jgi:hypothetical protein
VFVMGRVMISACCLLTVAVACAQTALNSPPSQSTEQLETGFTTIHGISSVPYQIRLLPTASFPQLPPAVARELDAMDCMIPQTYEAGGPENVINGSFEKQGSSDWAVLCSVKGITTLYVFFGSDLEKPLALRHQEDSKWLGKEWSFDYGSAWGISTVPAQSMPRTDNMDHDGIEDAFVEQHSVVHYYRQGRWTTLEAGDD